MILPKVTYSTPFILPNGNFEQGAISWSPDVSLWSFTNNQGVHPGGSGIWQAMWASSGTTTSSVMSNVRHIPCVPGQVLTLSGWVFRNHSASVGGTGTVRIAFYQADDTFISYTDGNYNTGNDLWLLCTATAAAPVLAAYALAEVVVYSDSTGAFLFDDITVTGAYQPQTLQFQLPAVTKPRFNRVADRTDTFSTAGVRQSVLRKITESYPINMPVIYDDGADLPAWQTFLGYAVSGGSFVFYPDSGNPSKHYTAFLVETTGKLEYASPGVYKFTGTFQLEITG